VAGGDVTALVRDVQYDPLSRAIIHLDFQHISLTEQIEVDVPVHFVGTPFGRQGRRRHPRAPAAHAEGEVPPDRDPGRHRRGRDRARHRPEPARERPRAGTGLRGSSPTPTSRWPRSWPRRRKRSWPHPSRARLLRGPSPRSWEPKGKKEGEEGAPAATAKEGGKDAKEAKEGGKDAKEAKKEKK
jgi:hypothetical protein